MAEGYHPVKKYQRADGSAEPTVEAAREGGLDIPYKEGVCRGALQIYQISVVELLSGQSNPVEIYGTIQLHSFMGDWKLYSRDKNTAETINVPGAIEVTPPTYCILPYDPVDITFDFDAESNFDEMNDEFLSWMPDQPDDEVRHFRVEGKKSTMDVTFIAFSRAVLADIEIFLDEEQEIWGTIEAFFSNKFEDLESFSLFNKGENNYVCVKAGEPIPLLRPFIAFLHGDGFDIEVKLKNISGLPVARGKISFRPNKFGNWVGVLGKDGEIQVTAKAALSPYAYHQPTIDAYKNYLDSLGVAIIDGLFVNVGLGESTQASVPASA